MNLRFETITDFGRFLTLRDDWNNLAKNSEVDHAFMRHEWFQNWINSFGRNNKLWIFTAWSDDKLMGIAPCQIVSRKARGVPIITLAFLYASISPRCNFILDPAIDTDKFFEGLISASNSTLIELRGMQSNLATTEAFLGFLRRDHGDAFMLEPGRTAPFTIIKNSWEDYYNNLTKKFKRDIRKYYTRLQEAESFEVRRYQTWEELEPIFDQLIEVSSRSWKAAEKTDLASEKWSADFYRDFSKAGSPLNLWEVYVLFINQQPTSFLYFLKHNEKRAAIRSDFDIQYDHYVPGTALKAEAIKQFALLPEDIEFDLVGVPDRHKVHWTDQLRDHITVTVNTSGTIGRSLLWAKREIVPLARFGRGHRKHSLCVDCERRQYSDWPQWYCGEESEKPTKIETF